MNKSAYNTRSYHPFQIVLPYIIVSTFWILFSDGILNFFIQDPVQNAALSVYKGLGFVIVTGLMLYALVRRYSDRLEASLSHFRTLFDTMKQGVVYQDANGLITLTNPSAEQILGLTLAELRGRDTLDPYQRAIQENGSPFPVDQHPAQIALRTGQSVNDVIMGLYHPQQHLYRWVAVTAVPEFQPGDSQPYQVYTTLTDITERRQTEEALRESDSRYHHILNTMMEGCQIIDFDWRYVFVNEMVASQGRYQVEELLGHTMMEMYPGIENTELFAILQLCMEKRIPRRIENHFIYPDDEVGWFELSIQPAPQGIFILSTDITERKKAEDAFRKSQEQYRGLLESLDSIVITMDNEGQFLYMNEIAARQWDGTPDQFIGKTTHDLFPEPFASELLTNIQQAIATDQPYTSQNETIVGGQPRWYRSTVQPIHDERGRVLHVLLNANDITELKLIQNQLEELNHTLEERIKERTAEVQDLYDNAPAGYHSLDSDGLFILVNQTELNWLGYSREEMIGRMHVRQILTPASQQIFSQMFSRFKTQGMLHDLELDFVRKDGTLLPVAVNATAIYDAQGQYVMSRSTVFNITERKQAEAELRAANIALAQVARLKDEFLASMSHELRTPLNAVLSFSESLEEGIYGPLEPRQIEVLRLMLESGRHLLDLINDILDLSKIEAGKFELQPGPMDVEACCQKSLQMIRQQAIAKQQRISTSFMHKTNLIYADERRLKQMLVNLLGNAVKFTPEGGVVGLEVEQLGDESIRFTVWDTGIGVPGDKLKELFRPFVQLDSSLSRQYAGTGLGLALVHRLAQLHGGGITVESELGHGSRFSFAIPLRSAQTEPYLQPAKQERSHRQLQDTGTPQITILLVEDNEINRLVTRDYLMDKGYQVLTAINGFEALAQVRAHEPKVILMDIQMPGMDGLEAIRQLRALPAFATVPIIALTALAMPGDRERCLEAGANEYLTKPVSLKLLRQRIEELR
jgi:PAS domain S-box-containing protein